VNTPRVVKVAAPAWAGRALATVSEELARSVTIRHVVVGKSPVPPEDAADTLVLWRYHLPADLVSDVIGELPALRWVHSDYVGIEDLPIGALRGRGIALSNGAGISARPMAEWVVLAILAAAKQLPRFVRQSDVGTWDMGAPLAELSGAVVLVLGLGAVGTAAAGFLEPFGMDVRGCVRRPRPTSDPLPRGVSRLVVGDAWREHLGEADYVVCALPLTPDTAGILDAAAFAAMRSGAWVVNVARGALMDHDALVAALDAGAIGGAVLDAFEREPLPPDSPLWGRPDVLVLPHVTWSTSHTTGDFKTRFAAQLARWLAGDQPADLVDLGAGY
jgi:phosphoglycerate dehydrogenase-like enzyme